MKIAVAGTGYVGLSLAVLLAQLADGVDGGAVNVTVGEIKEQIPDRAYVKLGSHSKRTPGAYAWQILEVLVKDVVHLFDNFTISRFDNLLPLCGTREELGVRS